MHQLLTRLMLAALPIAVACSSGDSLSVSDILGPYTATTFTATPTGAGTTDVIGAGGSMEITLFANGTTTGTLSVPALFGDPALLASLAGTFTLSGTTVTFDHATNTFVEEVTWSADGNRLICDQTLSGFRLHVVLTRT